MSRRRKLVVNSTFDDDHKELHPSDDNSRFFAKGRDFESRYVNHKYTKQERELLATYESLDYLPPHSHAYKSWLRKQPARLEWDRWLMMAFIGFSTGFIGFLLHQAIDLISDYKWEKTEEYLKESYIKSWGWLYGISLALVLIGSSIVVFLRPSAAGSGMPELIGFLNGTLVRNIFNIKTLIVKFFSCLCAVSSGLPVGPEGPMIHMGSLIGSGLSQFKSRTLGCTLPFFERFRNPEDRRNFISAGSAAGVASAFGAPVGGLLFAMEEVSSFWSMKLSWQIFFCCMISTFTTDLFNSAFQAFRYQGQFGLFTSEKYILFQVREGLDVNILMFFPTVIIGVIGGVLGGLFVFCNLKMARFRRAKLAKIGDPLKKKFVRLLEPCIIITIVATASVFLPAAFDCSPLTCYYEKENAKPSKEFSLKCLDSAAGFTESSVSHYTCPEGTVIREGENITFSNDTFNQVATLLFVTGEEAIHHLFSRETHWEFTFGPLFTVLIFYFIMACWSCGPSISSGLVVPMLYIGALYGRIIGLVMVTLFGVHSTADSYWAWMDPGAFALIGAASFFGGVSRLTMSLTVIMMEITNDIQFLLPIMVAIMVAKWVGDAFTHPIYHALLEVKCIPFLDSEPVIFHDAYLKVSVENELCILLSHESLFERTDAAQDDQIEIPKLDYQQVAVENLENAELLEERLHQYCEEDLFQNLTIDLKPYINMSAPCIPNSFSLHRTYIIFRTLGLRHLTVVDNQNCVVGMISRKDLMGYKIEEKIAPVLERSQRVAINPVEMVDNPSSAFCSCGFLCSSCVKCCVSTFVHLNVWCHISLQM
ncbi:chloride channel protein B-like [Anneissia japonica]|uniref:chloride channel protein B-like n=1 Tax=Anneissia japonica TaxID=1529436 RepID=UPI0014254DFA|nr:chloride channel protein B-like [Anneissia japonica]